MAGYLDQYGRGEERREGVIKKALIALAVIIVVGGPLLYIFHNFRQERQIKRFFALLSERDFKSAYALWGCTDAKPCGAYPISEFMKDWGPDKGNPSDYKITRSKSCGSGVILTVDFGNQKQQLWVQRDDLSIGFSPFPGCPAPNAMLGKSGK